MLEWDRALFSFINQSMTNPFFDWLMPAITDLHKISWFVFGLLPALLFFWFWKQRTKMFLPLLGLVLAIGAVDFTTYRALKPFFARERPPAQEVGIKLRTSRYAGYSFPSNHAANNFAGATFLSLCYPTVTIPAFLLAGTVAFSRIYIGVHYPADVLTGAFLGILFGVVFFRFLSIISKRRSWKERKSPVS